MRKLLLWGSGITMSGILLYFSLTAHITTNKPIATHLKYSQKKSDEDEDGPEKELRREFVMTVDPYLRTIPSERLATAMDQIKEVQSHKINGTSNITWTERGPNNIGGRTRAILIDASDATGNTVWAGSVGGGLWKTTNFKSATPSWTNVPGVSQNLALTSIAQNPSNSSIIYVGTGEGYNNYDAIRGLGVYQTTDGGNTWSLIPSTTTGGSSVNDFTYVERLLVYSNGDLYAACSSKFCNRGGILRLPNGGTTWTRVIGVAGGTCATSTDMVGIDIKSSASGDLYATTIDHSTGAVG